MMSIFSDQDSEETHLAYDLSARDIVQNPCLFGAVFNVDSQTPTHEEINAVAGVSLTEQLLSAV